MRSREYPPAFVVGRAPGHENEVGIGLKWLFQARDGEPLVVAPTSSQLRDGPLADALKQWPPVLTATARTLSQVGWGRGPVLAVWPDLKTLEKLERRSPSAICVVPWTFEEIDSWLRGRQATDLLAPGTEPAEPTITDAVVTEAMKSLTLTVNLGTSLKHPSDRANAIETFRLLSTGGHAWDAAEIERWALGNGWSIDGAGELRVSLRAS